MKIKIQSIKDFFKSKEKKGLKPIFFESIGDQNTSRDEKLKNLINVLSPNFLRYIKMMSTYLYGSVSLMNLLFYPVSMLLKRIPNLNFLRLLNQKMSKNH